MFDPQKENKYNRSMLLGDETSSGKMDEEGGVEFITRNPVQRVTNEKVTNTKDEKRYLVFTLVSGQILTRGL